MTCLEARCLLIDQLTPLYGDREARNIARIVLEELLQKRPVPLAAAIDAALQHRLRQNLERLLFGEPVQYVTGHAWFYGLRFLTDPRALIPRPETEELVRRVLETCRAEAPMRVLDIGTGSGCIAVTLKKNRPSWEVFALDISAEALELAQQNATSNQCAIHAIRQDILEVKHWLRWGRFDLIVSNPPYIPHSEQRLMPAQVLEYEPASALFVPDDDPLLFYEAIAGFAHAALDPAGYLFLEVNAFRAGEVARLMEHAGLVEVAIEPDMQGRQRMVSARMPGHSGNN